MAVAAAAAARSCDGRNSSKKETDPIVHFVVAHAVQALKPSGKRRKSGKDRKQKMKKA